MQLLISFYLPFIKPLKTQSVPRCKHFSSRLLKPDYGVSGTSRSLLSDEYKTHKYSVGRAYNS